MATPTATTHKTPSKGKKGKGKAKFERWTHPDCYVCVRTATSALAYPALQNWKELRPAHISVYEHAQHGVAFVFVQAAGTTNNVVVPETQFITPPGLLAYFTSPAVPADVSAEFKQFIAKYARKPAATTTAAAPTTAPTTVAPPAAVVPTAKAEAKPEAKAEAKPEAKAEAKAEAKSAAQPEPRPATAAAPLPVVDTKKPATPTPTSTSTATPKPVAEQKPAPKVSVKRAAPTASDKSKEAPAATTPSASKPQPGAAAPPAKRPRSATGAHAAATTTPATPTPLRTAAAAPSACTTTTTTTATKPSATAATTTPGARPPAASDWELMKRQKAITAAKPFQTVTLSDVLHQGRLEKCTAKEKEALYSRATEHEMHVFEVDGREVLETELNERAAELWRPTTTTTSAKGSAEYTGLTIAT